jgi:hypothetical protein
MIEKFLRSTRYVFHAARSTREEAEAVAQEAREWGLDAGVIRERNAACVVDGKDWLVYTKTAGESSRRYEIRDEAEGGRVAWSGSDPDEAARRYVALGVGHSLHEVEPAPEARLYVEEGAGGWYRLMYAGSLSADSQ